MPDSSDIIPNPTKIEASRPDVPDAEDLRHFYVLRRGFIAGPFSRGQLLEFTLTHTFGRDDMVQIVGKENWMPLAFALDESHAADTARAPQWRVILGWAWLRLRYNLDEESLRAGLVVTAIASVFVLLGRWPDVFWLPWIAAAILAGVALLRRKEHAPAVVVLLAAVGAAIGLWFLRP